MYRVIRYFEDLQDGNRAYKVGEIYPREGLSPSRERIEELASDLNKQHRPLIEAVGEKAEEDVPETGEITEDKPKKRKKRSE